MFDLRDSKNPAMRRIAFRLIEFLNARPDHLWMKPACGDNIWRIRIYRPTTILRYSATKQALIITSYQPADCKSTGSMTNRDFRLLLPSGVHLSTLFLPILTENFPFECDDFPGDVNTDRDDITASFSPRGGLFSWPLWWPFLKGDFILLFDVRNCISCLLPCLRIRTKKGFSAEWHTDSSLESPLSRSTSPLFTWKEKRKEEKKKKKKERMTMKKLHVRLSDKMSNFKKSLLLHMKFEKW